MNHFLYLFFQLINNVFFKIPISSPDNFRPPIQFLGLLGCLKGCHKYWDACNSQNKCAYHQKLIFFCFFKLASIFIEANFLSLAKQMYALKKKNVCLLKLNKRLKKEFGVHPPKKCLPPPKKVTVNIYIFAIYAVGEGGGILRKF